MKMWSQQTVKQEETNRQTDRQTERKTDDGQQVIRKKTTSVWSLGEVKTTVLGFYIWDTSIFSPCP